ncbi:Adenylyl-sulfate kinase [Methylobacterium adhaesivum]|jgi:adenylyl-sulfate kinase|uniref:Adenylyl-sulfate kinase n=1 Tax=Methylobacterium adhaesivum TaxID=333297 RepID=A0ABT8BI84_9HYPH|nr:adenylyl-sulfate kinase [Methylobacterium adhaesivum]MDN3591385.1 adenylyl-sulfate kinase [Methylobacterium adhaesivum]GJD32657.1 Adenylyl-sulfate kinase [Methylobacterium adhaesivum]
MDDARMDPCRMKPAIIWLTGLSGAGKSATAEALRDLLAARGHRATILDGDELRQGLSRDLGFGDAARIENIRRAAEVARILARADIVTIVSLISPFRKERAQARAIAGEIPFLEVYVDAPLAVCEERDPKGLYRRARAGLIPNFTGIDSAYEAPLEPDLHLHTDAGTPQDGAARVAAALGNL